MGRGAGGPAAPYLTHFRSVPAAGGERGRRPHVPGRDHSARNQLALRGAAQRLTEKRGAAWPPPFFCKGSKVNKKTTFVPFFRSVAEKKLNNKSFFVHFCYMVRFLLRPPYVLAGRFVNSYSRTGNCTLA